MAGDITLEFTGNERRAIAAIQRMEDKVARLETKLKDFNRTGEKTQSTVTSAFSSQQTGLQQYMNRLIGISGVITGINQSYEVWLANMREASAQADDMAKSFAALATTQDRGKITETVKAAANLAVSQGITDFREAANVIQGFVNTMGLQAGLESARSVFMATRAGLPLRLGRELEIIGQDVGMEPGEALRKAFIIGDIARRDPEDIAEAGQSIAYWQDKDLAFAAAGVLATRLKGRLEPHMRQATAALQEEFLTDQERSLARKALKKAGAIDAPFETQLEVLQRSGHSSKGILFELLGISGASELEKLRVMTERGIDTPAELEAFGITEERQKSAVLALIQNNQMLMNYLSAVQSGERDIIMRKRMEAEAEYPQLEFERVGDVLSARFKERRAFGPGALDKMAQERVGRAFGSAFEDMGMQEAFGFIDLQDEQGYTSPFRQQAGLWWAFLKNLTALPGGRVGFAEGRDAQEQVFRRVEQHLESAARRLDETATNLKGVTDSMPKRSAPMGVGANEDR